MSIWDPRQFILDENGNLVPEPDMAKWGEWMKPMEHRRVKLEVVGPYEVSTVFLGLMHVGGIWETMVLNGALEGTARRCFGNREQAEAMHAEFVGELLTELGWSEESQQRSEPDGQS